MRGWCLVKCLNEIYSLFSKWVNAPGSCLLNLDGWFWFQWWLRVCHKVGTQGSGSWWFVLLLFALLTDFGLVKYVWFCVTRYKSLSLLVIQTNEVKNKNKDSSTSTIISIFISTKLAQVSSIHLYISLFFLFLFFSEGVNLTDTSY